MAASEGIGFRWEAFNRWCDDYADRHQGMKPKVEDVRRWHRENAEKVWPECSERPSVFLAVSHNKGRRVRGHKTCEYYKRYRAGKAAEQQLAARLQPAALSGRRILAVTAAARKLNTDCARGVGKRPVPDDDAAPERELEDLEQTEKRRRIRSLTRSHLASTAHIDKARPLTGRHSSSEGLSEDPSWASGADTSDDDSGSVLAAAHGSLGRRSGAHAHADLRSRRHSGVHITAVRRDADGRTVQLRAQSPLHMQSSGMPAYATQQGLYAAGNGTTIGCVPSGSLRQPCRPRDSNGGVGQSRDNARYIFNCEDMDDEDDSDADAAGAGMDSEEPQGRAHSRSEDSRQATLEEDGLQQLQQRPGSSTPRDADNGWDGGPQRHPGVAPHECRATRSSSTAQQQRPPHFSGYVETPIGSMPVYVVAQSNGDTTAAVRRVRDGQWLPRQRLGVAVAAKDPLDLLAQAACEALASPMPVCDEGAAGAQVALRQQVEPAAWEGPAGPGCLSGASPCLTRSGNSGGGGGAGVVAVKLEPGAASDVSRRCSGPYAGAASAVAGRERTRAAAVSTASECASAATHHSGDGGGAPAARPQGTPGALLEAAAADATAVSQSKHAPGLSHSAAAMLAADAGALDAAVGAKDDTDGAINRPQAMEGPLSTAAAASSLATAALATSPVAAAVQAATAGTASGNSGGRPLGNDVDAGAAAGAAAATKVEVAAAAGAIGVAVALQGAPQQLPTLAGSSPPGCAAATVESVGSGASRALPAPAQPSPSWSDPTGAVGAAFPVPGDASALGALASGVPLGGHLLPMVRLLQMQMAARLEPLCNSLGSDVAGLRSAHSACAMPSGVDVGHVTGSTSPPHGMVVVPRSLQQSR